MVCGVVVLLAATACAGGGGSSEVPAFDGPKSLLKLLGPHFPPQPPSITPVPKGTGVYGYVLVEPACRTSNQPCADPDQVALARIAAQDSKSGDTTTGLTDRTGRFAIPLRPGTFEVAVASASAPGLSVKLCTPTDVLITESSYSYIQLHCIGA